MFSADKLLVPISDAQPSGADLSFSAELDAIALARRFDDPSLDQGEWVTELKEADWDFVARRCATLLETTSKDLRLAVWLTEAGSTQWHLRGLGEGLRLLAGLCEQFWDRGLYPESDGDDHDQRIGNLSWILSRIPALVRAMPLTEGRDSGYSSIDFEVARKVANLNESARPAGSLKLADLEAARRNSSPQFNAALAEDARACADALKALEQVADVRLGNDSPGFSAAREALQDMLRTLPAASTGAVEGAAAGVPEHALPAGEAHAAQQPGQPAAPAAAPGVLQTRAQALQQLRLVAQFFRRTEPHSPVSYFADKAADAGEQDLHTWLRSVVKDAGSLAHIEELLGVQAPGSE